VSARQLTAAPTGAKLEPIGLLSDVTLDGWNTTPVGWTVTGPDKYRTDVGEGFG